MSQLNCLSVLSRPRALAISMVLLAGGALAMSAAPAAPPVVSSTSHELTLSRESGAGSVAELTRDAELQRVRADLAALQVLRGEEPLTAEAVRAHLSKLYEVEPEGDGPPEDEYVYKWVDGTWRLVCVDEDTVRLVGPGAFGGIEVLAETLVTLR